MATSPQQLADLLERLSVRAAPGLSPAEIQHVEREHGFRFPDDLRALLQIVLPAGQGWPDWRRGVVTNRDHAGTEVITPIREVLGWPLEGILFDVEHGFWLDSWVWRPPALEDAQRIATEHVAAAPVLIPVYAQRYLPGEPSDAGNPIFSVHQTDIIIYGR